MSGQAEMPIFTKTYDFLAWLVPMTDHFPRSHRHVTTRRLLLEAGYAFLECLVDANSQRGRTRLAHLNEADASLDKVRLYLRLAHHWRWMNAGQYEHVSRMVAELGRLLGGWQRITRQTPSNAPSSDAPDG